MENTQEISSLLEIAKIAVPSLIALIVPLITYLWLSQKLADYQAKMSKEIESYKVELQSEFQTRFYTYQTKFSLWHQRREAVAVETFEKLAELFNLFQRLANWQNLQNYSYPPIPEEILVENLFEECVKQHKLFGDYYDKKRIYLDEVIRDESLNIYRSGIRFLKLNFVAPDDNLAEWIVGNEMLLSMNRIEDRFEVLFSPEKLNKNLEKK